MYFTRKSLPSYKMKTSKHITRAKKIYNVDNIIPNKELSQKTGCSLESLKKILTSILVMFSSTYLQPHLLILVK